MRYILRSLPSPRPSSSNEDRKAGIKNSAKVTFQHFQIEQVPGHLKNGLRLIEDAFFGISYLYSVIFPKKYLELPPNVRHGD